MMMSAQPLASSARSGMRRAIRAPARMPITQSVALMVPMTSAARAGG